MILSMPRLPRPRGSASFPSPSGIVPMEISGRSIGPDQPPYVIAEVSNNHLADPERACRLIEVAAKAGADAVKIQTYDADSLTIDSDRPEFVIRTPPWEGLNYYQLYKKIALPRS